MMRKQIGIFLIAGSLTTLVDFFVYKLLCHFELLNLAMAKSIGFLVGTLFAYVINRLWTFSQQAPRRGTAERFVLLYVSTLAVNVMVNSLALSVLANLSIANQQVQIAFIFATATSASLNFLGMKFFVFKTANQPEYQ